MTAGAPALTALLDELDRLRAAATPGPWFAWNRGVGWMLALDPDGDRVLPEGFRTDLERGEDAQFITAAVNAVPRLAAAIRAALHWHQRDPHTDACSEDGQGWPCDTYADIAAALEPTP